MKLIQKNWLICTKNLLNGKIYHNLMLEANIFLLLSGIIIN
jgi:hypothetical protein